MSERLLRITAPDFCAGVVIKNGVCAEAAPKLRWLCKQRKSEAAIRAYAKRKGWKVEVVK